MKKVITIFHRPQEKFISFENEKRLLEALNFRFEDHFELQYKALNKKFPSKSSRAYKNSDFIFLQNNWEDQVGQNLVESNQFYNSFPVVAKISSYTLKDQKAKYFNNQRQVRFIQSFFKDGKKDFNSKPFGRVLKYIFEKASESNQDISCLIKDKSDILRLSNSKLFKSFSKEFPDVKFEFILLSKAIKLSNMPFRNLLAVDRISDMEMNHLIAPQKYGQKGKGFYLSEFTGIYCPYLGDSEGKVEEFDRSLQSIFDYMGMDYVNQEIEKAKAKLQKNYGSTLFSDYGYNLKEYTELMAYLIEEGQNVHLKSPGDWETSHSTII